MTDVMPAIRYPEISPRSYEHPADRAATSALHAIPLLDRLIKQFGRLGIETHFRQMMLGDSVRLGPDQVPAIWSSHVRAATRLDLDPTPLFVTQAAWMNALTFGMRSPVVVVSSALAKEQPPDQLESILGHELGHVLSDHVTYSTMLALLHMLLTGTLGSVPLAGLPLRGLYLVLLEWHRAAELSCDRAAALEIDDPVVVCRALMNLTGGTLEGMSVDAFIRQAAEYTGEEDLFARPSRFLSEMRRTHPPVVRRVKELITWVESGDFDRIRSGSYIRRGQEPPPSAEFEDAVAHYRSRFTAMVERTIGGVNKLSNQISSWLRRNDEAAHAGGEDTEPTED